jgi:hypothetical protein
MKIYELVAEFINIPKQLFFTAYIQGEEMIPNPETANMCKYPCIKRMDILANTVDNKINFHFGYTGGFLGLTTEHPERMIMIAGDEISGEILPNGDVIALSRIALNKLEEKNIDIKEYIEEIKRIGAYDER